MDITDILALDEWVTEWIPQALNHYQPLASVVQNNSQPQAAQPVEPPLEKLIEFLKTVPMTELSTQQIDVLDALDIGHLLGRHGAYWVRKTVRTSTYDPATTNSSIQEAVSSLQQAVNKMQNFVNAAEKLGFYLEDLELEEGRFRVSVCFRQKVSIETVPDLKNRSNDWFKIIAGVSEAIGEKPEDTQVIGVANGSIWVVLGTTAAMTKALAIISKHAREVSSNVFGILNDIEDYRAKKRMNELMERGFQQALEEAKDNGFTSIMEELKPLLPANFAPEKLSKLESSVKQMLAFVEKGGDVDFSTPPDMDPNDDNFDEEVAEIVSEVKGMIADAQAAKQGVLLLEQKQADAAEDDD